MKRLLFSAMALLLVFTGVLGGCSSDEDTAPSSPESEFPDQSVEAASSDAVSSEYASSVTDETVGEPSDEASREDSDVESSIEPSESSDEASAESSADVSDESFDDVSDESSDDVSEAPPVDDTKPQISLNKTEFEVGETIAVSYKNTDSKDWVGIYPEGNDPGPIPSITWQYSVGEGKLAFSVSSLKGPGVYWIFLCDNDGYDILDTKVITVLDNDTTDYGAKSASVSASVTDGYSKISVTVTPGYNDRLTYKFYWSKGKTRLSGYDPICTKINAGTKDFTVEFNDCLYMPDEADGIEVAVAKGRSKSVFVSAPKSLKAPKSKLLYKFAVFTDLHIISSKAHHVTHLKAALNDVKELGGYSAIFTTGDNTDTGSAAEWDLLLKTVNSVEGIPDIYYALGNHDMVYGSGHAYQVNLFKQKTGMPDQYYSVELNGIRHIVLGSDIATTAGGINKPQLDWLRSELSKCDKSKPTFIFLHQPLKETVSGTLYSKNNVIQDWFGVTNAEKDIRAMLKEFPNAILFTGHTHWSLESMQPILAGHGDDATFVNCASVGYLWDDTDKETAGSQGYFVEVYEDYILLRGREFVKGNWCGAAQFLIPRT